MAASSKENDKTDQAGTNSVKNSIISFQLVSIIVWMVVISTGVSNWAKQTIASRSKLAKTISNNGAKSTRASEATERINPSKHDNR